MANAIVVDGLSKRYEIGELQASYGTLRDSLVKLVKGGVHRHGHHDEHVWALDDVSFELAEGVSGRPLFGEGAMLNVIEFEPGATVPLHSHPHEQLGLVLRGMQALVVDGVAHELQPMEGYVLPGGVEHSAYCGPEGALVLDVFRPVREDYRSRWETAADRGD